MSTHIAAAILILAVGCTTGCVEDRGVEPQPDPTAAVPSWTENAIWYQIFVERFRNGDPSNDPDLTDIQGADPEFIPKSWKPTPWTHDWYRQERWAKDTGRGFYFTAQLRRYGGDLQGVRDKLDYLQKLGVTAIYFNPLNDAPSLHKYDARNYHHIDRNFGPDPDGDAAIIAGEMPDDPSTWTWTSADSLFLQLLDELHQRGMRAIVDYSWNHTGRTFWAWKDVVQNQAESKYADWYEIDRFDDPATPENEFSYRGWAGVRSLPNLRKVGNQDSLHRWSADSDLNPGAKAHVFAVTKRWLDPNGDGDPSDGVDGFRLDVAEMVPIGFWRDYRRFVKSINPEAYLVGEIWWEKWPDRMMDPRPYLGDVFDAVMNYRWYMPTRSLFAGALPRITPTSYVAHLDSIESGIAVANLRAMMNLAASHDSPRVSTSLYNKGRYKHRDSNRAYKLGRPDLATQQVQKMLLVQQFTYYGAPHIWNGDEVGMWGADDPDNRKPIVWSDLTYESEVALPSGETRTPDPVRPDTNLFNFYRRLIEFRTSRPDLMARGDLEYDLADDEAGLLAYRRALGADTVAVVFNVTGRVRSLQLQGSGKMRTALSSSVESIRRAGDTITLPPRSAVILANH